MNKIKKEKGRKSMKNKEGNKETTKTKECLKE